MKMPFNLRTPAFDANAINETIRSALASAGIDTASGPMQGVTETIRRALASADSTPAPSASAANGYTGKNSVIDVASRVVGESRVWDNLSERPAAADARVRPQVAGTFETHSFTNHAGTRAYKLFVPKDAGEAPPMVLMLHGCTQSAEDFAAGTRMNQLAQEMGFIVVYPEQASNSNPSRCWNWFNTQDQLRDAGEPALIAGMARAVAERHGVDKRRIFVAGLSAGAAMAVILGETYPELFAGVGVHSGLPYASARDIPSAMAAMKGGRSGLPGLQRTPGAAGAPRASLVSAVPTIVFHGDRDHTVQHDNGAEIVQQAANAHAANVGQALTARAVENGTSVGGRRYSRSVLVDAAGQPRIESWTVHGAGHAWAGGSASGTYTDGSGPDASAEMARFFLAVPHGEPLTPTPASP